MKRFKVFVLVIALLGAFTLILSGCGGGGGGGTTTGGGTGGGGTPQTLSGTVATGKPLKYATVYLKDVDGHTTSVRANENGKFSINTKDLKQPFYLKVQEQGYDLYSYTDQKSGTANITPLTTAVVAIANNGNPDIFTSPPAQPLDIVSAKNKLLQEAGVRLVMQKYGLPENADPISREFNADGTGMDAVLDSIVITVHTAQNIEIKNPFTNTKIGEITFTGGTATVPNPVDPTEVSSLPSTNKYSHTKYFAYIQDNYLNSPNNKASGPIMVDIVDDGNGKLSVTLTAIEGDSGDPFLIYGNGTKSGNNITFTVHVIMCSDTAENANSANANAVFTGTIGSDGTITGTFTNTLPAGDTCKENNSNTYSGTFTAYDVTNATPVNMSGTYNAYATPFGGWIQVNPPTWTPTWWGEQGPATLTITQNGSSISASLTFINGDTGATVTKSGQGTVYGNYVMFAIPVIMCHDTNANAVAENAIFYGKFENGTITGIYGDGVPSGDYCKATNYTPSSPNTTSAIGTWRAVKK